MTFTRTARRLGMAAALGIAMLEVVYAGTLTVGLLSLATPQDPIGDPMFSVLEILILAMAPAMVLLMVAVHAWARPEVKPYSLAALVFTSLVAGMTSALHFTILTVSRKPELVSQPWLPLVLGFRWPSFAYAWDILAWDVFFPLAMFCAAPVFRGSRLARAVAALLVVAGALALAGLGGVVADDMRLRNLGIVGYVPVFLVAVVAMAVLFRREQPAD